MSRPSSSPDPEIRLEQAYLDRARADLAAMRKRAAMLLEDLVGAGNPDLDYQAALVRRVRLLAESPRPLLFGRIDEVDGPSWHIGRRHVEDSKSDPIVVDWRAPVSVPFYRARPGDALGLDRRRQIMVDRNLVLSVADDLFGSMQEGDVAGTRLRGGDALLAELERARTGEMLDIVATIQAEQDEIIRAPLSESLAVQGGPGTGKTAVGLHRAAFLIYNHPSLSRDGVLVLGPSRAFIRYIAQVLPSLGEEAVVQTTIGDIAPKAKTKGHDPMEVRRLKGDARMGELLQRALMGRRRRMDRDLSIGVRFARSTVSAERINALVDGITARPAPYRAGRMALRNRLVSEVRRTFRDAGKAGVDESWFEPELVDGDEFRSLLDHLWPPVSASALVRDLLGSRSQLATFGEGLLEDGEWPLLLKAKTGNASAKAAWTIDDLPLLDEAAFLTGGRTRSYGHVVIDEAQDLTPMQFRMVARRTPTGSMTILGDLAQATGPWTYDSWDEILEHLPSRAPTNREELTLGYRAPGKVLDFASRLLAVAAPSITATTSIRAGRADPRLIKTTVDDLLNAGLAEAQALGHEYGLVALIAAPDQIPHLVKLSIGKSNIGLLNADGMTRAITIVPAPEAKGLEFDAVVVIEPATIVRTDPNRRRGLRLLYVAMTRPIQHLSIVHADPLPSPLA